MVAASIGLLSDANFFFLAVSIARRNFISGAQASSAMLRGHNVMLSEAALTAALSFNKE